MIFSRQSFFTESPISVPRLYNIAYCGIQYRTSSLSSPVFFFYLSITSGTGILTFFISSTCLTQFQRSQVLVVSICAIYGSATVVLILMSIFEPNYLLIPKTTAKSFGVVKLETTVRPTDVRNREHLSTKVNNTGRTRKQENNTEHDLIPTFYKKIWEHDATFFNVSYVSVVDGLVRVMRYSNIHCSTSCTTRNTMRFQPQEEKLGTQCIAF